MRRFEQETERARESLELESLSVDEVESMRLALSARAAQPRPHRLAGWLRPQLRQLLVRIQAPGLSPRTLLWSGAAVAAALGLAVIISRLRPETSPAGFRVARGAECVVEQAQGIRVVGGCGSPALIEVDQAQVALDAGSRLSRNDHGLQLEGGRAEFAVQKRHQGAPLGVRVSAGIIVVTGTRFVVEQDARGGSVQVSEGTIEFHWADGSPTSTVTTGNTLSWPKTARVEAALPDSAPPEPAPTTPLESERPKRAVRVAAPAAEPDVHQVMQRTFQLRTQGQYDQAIAVLEQATRDHRFSEAQRERFSFEVGELIGQRLGQAAGCAHWQRHEREFPNNPHTALVRDRLRACTTNDEGPP